ncbi:MAG: NAD(P)/FAD-dependent oxidoreductase [Polyangiaceae bacterium]|nr:NAD(P)/FAD-dependent oxidoreductase [Polyangiaceae bacterium]
MATEHFDVLIVGAGLSGVGAACHLTLKCPGKTFAILEGRATMGGTWDLFRYPGIRSDSDMYTLGYSFRPWTEAKAIADGSSILKYIQDTAREFGVDRAIRYNHKVVRAEWKNGKWHVEAARGDTGETAHFTCGFLFGCTGYYRYDEGYTPPFAGRDRFKGQIIHPQHWPQDLDYTGKRIVVIGSGATAVTLVPALSERAAHVTMLQRSPSYILSLPGNDPIADKLRKRFSSKTVYPIVRWKNVLFSTLMYQVSRRAPSVAKSLIRKGAERFLPKDYNYQTHLNPSYQPWDQRLCLVPDGDLFKSIRDGKADIVTDHIDTFTETGIKLKSGQELQADIIVTATGLRLLAIGGMKLFVDGKEVQLSETVGYKGMMFSGIPNLAVALGYTNASWTLKCDLVAEYVCRLIQHMDKLGYTSCVPKAPDASVPLEPFLDLQSGYVQRSIQDFPKQAKRAPWRLNQNYMKDLRMFRHASVEDEGVEFR